MTLFRHGLGFARCRPLTLRFCSACFAVMTALFFPHSLAASAAENVKAAPLSFQSAGTNGYVFDTGVLRGQLRAQGRSAGLTSVVYIPTGERLDAGMGWFGHYRVFSANQRYGNAAWDWPSESKLRPDGSVEVKWPAAPDRPFELAAVYRWAAADILDLETTVHALTNLAGFESFLASYFAPGFTNSLVHAGPGPEPFLAAEPSSGTWQAFPRDAAAVLAIKDGRWTHPPSPVDWAIRPAYTKCVGLRRAPASRLTAAIMSSREDCFAILTPHQTEGHRSMYLSLFGRNLKADETARARARLVVAAAPTDGDVVAAWAAFASQSQTGRP
jgi:hypothetical protein